MGKKESIDTAVSVIRRSYPLRNSSKSVPSSASTSPPTTTDANSSPANANAIKLTKSWKRSTMAAKTTKAITKAVGRQTANQKSKSNGNNNNNNNVQISPCKTRSKRNLSTKQVVVAVKKENGRTDRIGNGASRSASAKAAKSVEQVIATTKKTMIVAFNTASLALPVTAQSDGDTSADSTVSANDANAKTSKQRKRTKKKYLCQICNKEFLGGNDLRKHIRIHTGERPFACQHCDKRFRQGGCLKNHIASQHGTTETYICDYCKKAFPIKERLRLHLRLHSGEKPYSCELCGKSFARGGQLTQHLVTHNGTKKYHCNQCPASFSCQMNLKLHLKGHSNTRDYTCHLCGKTFTRPDALRKHLVCIHQNVKAFFCNICSRTFKGHLPQHMRTHNNVKTHGCGNCGATFSQKSQLIVHHRIHSGERPYRCQVCWQAFAHSSVLKLHIRKHTGEKPFRCMMCTEVETAFSQLPHLKTHMRAIHGMDKAYKCMPCSEFFKTKHELVEHKLKCAQSLKQNRQTEPSQSDPAASEDNTSMSLSKLRLLIAVLLKEISSQDRLKKLGFDKRLIDNVLIAALQMAEQPVCGDNKLSEIERLRINVNQFLKWTIPEDYMEKLELQHRTPEEVLENLASHFRPKEAIKSNNNIKKRE